MRRPAEPTASRSPGAGLPIVLACLLGACGPVEADHPLDPETPPARQQPSRLSGHLVAPAGVDLAPFADARVELWSAEERPDDTVVSTSAYTAPVDAAGRFRFDAVAPGVYRLDARTADLAADPLLLSVPFGEVIDLGAMILEPRWGTLTGRVLGPGDRPVADATVGVDAQWAQVGDDGRFTLVAAAGRVSVTARAPGYAPAERPAHIRAGQATALDMPLRLEALPASLDGRVSLRRFSTPEREAAITLELNDGAAVVAPIDGAFAFDDLDPGAHVLVARANGYDPVERRVTLVAGQRLTLDPIHMLHGSTGPEAVWLEARVEDGAGAPLAGVAVDVRIDSVPFDRAVSDRDGRVVVAADRADRYWLDARADGHAPASHGPLVWDAERDAFRGLEGESPTLVLPALP